tara:strand:+ start:107 stop:421 length:315 start_codon:yes stop_codon:yes gene_type:complete
MGSWNGGQTGSLIEFLKTAYFTFLTPLITLRYQTQFTTVFTPGRINKIRPYYLNNHSYGKNSKSCPEDIVPIHSLPLNHCTLINITVSDVSLNSKASAITRLRV